MAASIGVKDTCFQKKRKTKLLNIRGTKPSVQNGQLLVSTGIPSFDFVIGGGVPVGSVLLVEEDKYGSYANLLVKYSLAEGILCGHDLFLSCADNRTNILQNLPQPIDSNPIGWSKPQSEATGRENMKIAWRYEHLPKQQTEEEGVGFGHYYDLSKTMDEDFIKNVKVTHHQPREQKNRSNMNPYYKDLLDSIQHQINVGKYNSALLENKDRTILRIVLQSFGSPQWGEENCPTDYSLLRFLHALRALMRTSLAVCLVTIPTHIFQDGTLTRRIEQLCDTVVEIESFVGSEKEENNAYKDYHGLFTIKKLARLNGLTSHVPDSFDLAFKLKKKKFVIEKLHLPPDLSESVSRSQQDPVRTAASSNFGCASSAQKNKLDF